MKQKSIAMMTVLLFGVIFLAPINAYAQETATLSLQEALDKAYEKNADLRKAALQVEKAEKQRNDAGELVYYTHISGPISAEQQNIINLYQKANINYNSALRSRERTKDQIDLHLIQAYTGVLKSVQDLESIAIEREALGQKEKVLIQSNALGLVSNYDLTQFNTGKKQLAENEKAVQSAYESSLAELRGLLGESDTWTPELVSQPVLDTYERSSLDTEISRGLANADVVWQAKAQLEVQQSQEPWFLLNASTQIQQIDLNLAEIDYEQSKKNTVTQIEQLYYAIDSLESQIRNTQLQYEQAQKDMEMAQLKYDVGILPKVSLNGDSLNGVRQAADKAKLALDKQRNTLITTKTQFAYLTGQELYNLADWSEQ